MDDVVTAGDAAGGVICLSAAGAFWPRLPRIRTRVRRLIVARQQTFRGDALCGANMLFAWSRPRRCRTISWSVSASRCTGMLQSRDGACPPWD